MSPAGKRWRRPPQGRLGRAWRFLSQEIWLIELGTLSSFRAATTRASRVLLLTGRGFVRDRCMQQAAALTYMTLFSLVPLLAFLVALAKSFGAYAILRRDTIEPFLDRTFGELPPAPEPPPLPEETTAVEGARQLREVIDEVLHYVEETDLTGLGAFGLVLLIYVVVKTLSAVERALNDIWGVKRPRTLVRKVTDYLAIAVVSPAFLLAGASLIPLLAGMTGRVGPVVPLLALVPLAVICGGFGFVIYTLPNTSVRVTSALIGGTFAGLCWHLVQILHLGGQVSLAAWNPIYSGFAALPLLLLWIYLSWVILLLGAELACAHQTEPTYASLQRTGVVDQAFREALAPRLAGRIAHAFLHGAPAPTAAQLAAETGVAPRATLQVLDDLVVHGLLARTEVEDEEAYLPARDPDAISVADLIAALRSELGARPVPVTNRLDERTDQLLARLREEARASLHNHTLAELARLLDPPGDPSEQDRAGDARGAREPGVAT